MKITALGVLMHAMVSCMVMYSYIYYVTIDKYMHACTDV